jgi:hypothetical protein
MTGFRLATLLTIMVALADGTVGDAKSQTLDTQRPKSPAQLAADIAHTISVSAPKGPLPPSAPVAFEVADSHGNSVEVKYIIRNLSLFSLLKNRQTDEKVRVTKATRYCTESHMAAMRQGVVIHEILAVPDNSEHIDYTIDISTCNLLPKPQIADAATLAELAGNVAKAENSRKGRPVGWFRLDGATAHGGVVEERFIVRDTSARDGMLADRANFEGLQKAYFCPAYRNDMLRGVKFHLVFVCRTVARCSTPQLTGPIASEAPFNRRSLRGQDKTASDLTSRWVWGRPPSSAVCWVISGPAGLTRHRR